LVWHMLRNDMRCPVCRMGPAMQLNIASSLPAFLVEIFELLHEAQSSSSSDLDANSEDSNSDSDDNSSNSIAMSIVTGSPQSISEAMSIFAGSPQLLSSYNLNNWSEVRNSVLESCYLLAHTQIIRVTVRILSKSAPNIPNNERTVVDLTGFASRVNFSSAEFTTRITQMQYQLQRQLKRRVCAVLYEHSSQGHALSLQIGIALNLGAFNTQSSSFAFCHEFDVTVNNDIIWEILHTTGISMGLVAFQYNDILLQLQWQWILRHAQDSSP
jgi:hypothetical protein